MLSTQTYKKRTLLFVKAIIFILFLAPILIYVFDPYQIFHRSYFYPDQAYGKTIFQDAGIINNYPFDSIIIGSSMLENTPAHEASNRIGGNFANLSFSDSDFYERHIVLNKVLPRNLKNVIYSLDEHVYLYPRFGHKNRSKNTYDFLYDDNPYNDYKVYLNWNFIKLLFEPPSNTIDLPNPWITNPQTSIRFGGWENWIKYPAPSWEKDFIPVRLPLAAKLSIHKKESLGEEKPLTRSRKSYLRDHVIRVFKRYPKTTVHLIFPPYYRYVHANERQNDPVKFLQYQAAIRFVAKKTKKYKNIKVYIFDELPFTADIANYTDLTHFKPEYNIFILDAIAKGEHLITSENVEQYLSDTAKIFYDFDLVKLNNEVQEIVKDIEKNN